MKKLGQFITDYLSTVGYNKFKKLPPEFFENLGYIVMRKPKKINFYKWCEENIFEDFYWMDMQQPNFFIIDPNISSEIKNQLMLIKLRGS